VLCACRASDSALIAVDAVAGIQVGTVRAWHRCEALGMARGVVVTGLDRENTDFSKTLAQIQDIWGKKCVPAVFPLPGCEEVVDVLGTGGAKGAGGEQAGKFMDALTEHAAESEDALIEKYLGGEALTEDELHKGLRAAVRAGNLVPVFAAISTKDIGVNELLAGITRLFPSPEELEVEDDDGKAVETGRDAPFVGLVWRTVTDPYAGRLVFIRVLGGTLAEDMEVMNVSKGNKERIGSLLVSCGGKKPVAVPEASAGDIVALPKLKGTTVNDVLCAIGHKVGFKPIVFPSPVVSFAAVARERADEGKIGIALSRAAEDDPSLTFERRTDTNELVISGMGDVHVEVAHELMKKRSNVDVDLKTPKVPYRETVTAQGEGHYKHKKQSGGRGQYGEVYARIEANKSGEEWFGDAVVGGVIPRNFIPACEKGFAEAMRSGVVAGFPVVDVKVTVHDGSYHDVDSSEIAFKIAASRAFKDAMSKGKPVLLEPIMKVKVAVPGQYMGDINGDLNHKRGRILGVGLEDGMQVITAEVPQAEIFRYSSELRSMTGGRGSFEMSFLRYDVVPAGSTQKIVASAEKGSEEEE
ncbi:elongation factor G, partial [Verrucomicrobiota bacterium]